MLLRALVTKKPDDHFKTQTDEAVHATAVACGLAFDWTTECVHHKGKTIPFEKYSKFNVAEPMRVVTTEGCRAGLQDILSAMGADLSTTADPKFSAWHHMPRQCSSCEEAGNRTEAVHKLNLSPPGPSHFIAQTEADARLKKGGSVFPSPSVSFFGAHYTLIAVVYALSSGYHFSCQAYFPNVKCWAYYDDKKNSQAKIGPTFNTDLNKGQEYLLLYIRNDHLIRNDCLVLDEVKQETPDSSASETKENSEEEGEGDHPRKKARRIKDRTTATLDEVGKKGNPCDLTCDDGDRVKPQKYEVRVPRYIYRSSGTTIN